MGGKISKIISHSIAEEIGIEVNDTLVAINDNKINDLIDYNFFAQDEYLELTIKKANSELWIYEIEKFADEELGLVFESSVFDGIRSCNNNCIFCFINQLQPEPRSSLLIKDDDYRMSFLSGNFITCTNLTDDDFTRIGQLHISPLYISVHTVDPNLRQQMLGTKKSGEILLTLQKLISLGCRLHTQIVLCPDINDKDKLDKTINSLANLAVGCDADPTLGGVESIAVIPVGITRFQTNAKLRQYSKEEARQVIKKIETYQKQFTKTLGNNFVFAADELYIKANLPFPEASTYDDFAQLENGIGMAARFIDSWQKIKNDIPKQPASESIAIITGVNGKEVLYDIIEAIKTTSGSKLDLIAVENTFFGSSVTTTGLLTGSCIAEAIPKDEYDKILIPANMLKFDQDIFLDNMTVEQLAKQIGSKVQICEPDPGALIEAIFNNTK